MNIAVILAGGKGKRFTAEGMPKQFYKIDNKEILLITLEKFIYNEYINKILIVMNKEWIEYSKKILTNINSDKIFGIIEGGDTRQLSSYKAISYLKNIADNNDIIIIHDAVRPFIRKEIIVEAINETKKIGACCVVVKTTDTIIEGNNKIITKIYDRTNMYNEQTPQCFMYSLLTEGYESCDVKDLNKFTDDISFIHKIDKKISYIEGDYFNIKITTKFDFLMAKMIYNEYENL